MSETQVMIREGDHLLEGLFAKGSFDLTAAIVCHPHPLYGGSMDNGVVETVQKVLRRGGCSTLRFNFRGVGRSGGSYGDGEGEAEDLKAAVSYLRNLGFKALHLAGYSFGAWIVLKALGSNWQPASLVLVSPPIDFLKFDDLKLPSCPSLITLGDRDDFCKRESFQAWIAKQPVAPELININVLSGCDHFYWGNETVLSAKIAEFLKKYFRADIDSKK